MASKFKILLHNGKTTLIGDIICDKTTVKQLKVKIHDKEGIKLDGIDLLAGGTVLHDDKLLSDYGMGGSVLPISIAVSFNTIGGSQEGAHYVIENNIKKNDDVFIPKSDFTHPLLKKSNNPCCLCMGEDDEINVEIGVCGCVFSPIALNTWANSQLKEETGFKMFKCPNKPVQKNGINVAGCKKNNPEWSFSMVACATGWTEKMSDDYYIFYTKKQLDPRTHKQCPFCYNFVFKSIDDKILRRRCSYKNCPLKQDWCWYCSEPWKLNSVVGCGNMACVISNLNKTLAECEEKQFKWNNSVDMMLPSVRACIEPSCHRLTNQPANCNEITCDNCLTKWCFICLKPWPCPEGRKNHNAAPRQVLENN